jgi:hypothetical protein
VTILKGMESFWACPSEPHWIIDVISRFTPIDPRA